MLSMWFLDTMRNVLETEALVDTGCDEGARVSSKIIHKLGFAHKVNRNDTSVPQMIDINGSLVLSLCSINLTWRSQRHGADQNLKLFVLNDPSSPEVVLSVKCLEANELLDMDIVRDKLAKRGNIPGNFAACIKDKLTKSMSESLTLFVNLLAEEEEAADKRNEKESAERG
jgi:hypothetical protein